MKTNILRLQKALLAEGFNPGAIDGIDGKQTQKALADWKAWASTLPRGIDISRWQPIVNWPEVKKDGVQFVFIKCTDGYGKDPMFEKHRAGAKSVGLYVGYYHFFRPSKDLEKQAQTIFDAVGVLGSTELPIAIDVERDDIGADGVAGTKDDVKATQKMVEEFIKLVHKKTGKMPIVYSYGPYFIANKIKINYCPLWIAEYRGFVPSTPLEGFQRWSIHQWIGNAGKQNGVKGACDLNICRVPLNELALG